MELGSWQRVLRIILIIFNMLYSIPSYLVWTSLLRPLLYFKPDWYYMIEGILFSWLLHFVAFWAWNAGCSVVETGDDMSDCIDSECLLLVNHQSTGDVPVIIQALTDANKLQLSRHVCWILDDMFKYTHFGLPCHVHGDFFILQGRQTRNAELVRLADHIRNVYVKRDRTWIVLFPEGGFLCNRKESSQAYGHKHGYPHLEHVTLPRIGVTQTILQELSEGKECLVTETSHRMTQKDCNDVSGKFEVILLSGLHREQKSLKYVIDVTIGYLNGRPYELLKNVVAGDSEACETVIHYRKYPAATVPRSESMLMQWLYERFAEKDRLLDHFYRTGKFPVDCLNGSVVVENTKRRSILRPVSFSPAQCLMMHAFYVLSTLLHIYLAVCISCTIWSLFA